MADKDIKLKQKEPFPAEPFKKTKQDYPTASETGAGVEDVTPLTFFFASSADTIQVWGKGSIHKRDRQLREFWRSETMLASALYNVSARNAAFEWEIESKSEVLEEALTLMFNNAIVQNSRGWIPFIMALSEDYYGTDNGAFIEIIRDESGRLKREEAPVIGIAHLDSNRCTRTGNPTTPVVYRDRKGRPHKMPWYSIIALSEFPSSVETMNGVGFCAVSRVLKHAQILRNLAIYKDEKVAGRFYRAIHFVGGVSRKEIEDMQNRGEEEADNRGQTRFIMPQIIASLDPEKAVSVATIDLASLPDNFELDEELRWYINGLAMGFGVDYQEFAPLPGGNIGSSAQSEILHRKSRGKGAAVFMQTLENVFLYQGVIPKGTKFLFVEKDMFEEAEKQELRTKLSEEMAILVGRGIFRPRDAREQMVKRGFVEAEDIAGIPDEYGEDIVRGAGNRQLVGSRGSNTIAEDAGRVEKALRRMGLLR